MTVEDLKRELASLMGNAQEQDHDQVAALADRLIFFDASEEGELRLKVISPSEFVLFDAAHQRAHAFLSALSQIVGAGFMYRVSETECALISFTGEGEVVRRQSPHLASPSLGDATARSINGIALAGLQADEGAALMLGNGAVLECQKSATVSGKNTGDQTISLQGDVEGSGSGAFNATITPRAVTFEKLQSITPGLLGRQKGAGSIEVLPLGATGQFKSRDNKTVTVRDGLIVAISKPGG